jgi:hypothetical protein
MAINRRFWLASSTAVPGSLPFVKRRLQAALLVTMADPNLLYAATQQSGQFLLILLWDIDAQRWTTHASSMRPNNST